jgi:flotillin
MMDWLASNGVAIGMIAVLVVVVLILLFNRWEKVGPNEVLIVSGRPHLYQSADGAKHAKGFSLIQGGWTWVRPWEKADRLSLELMTLELNTPEFYTRLGVPIVVDGIAQIKIRSDDPIATATAAEMFLSKSTDDLNQVAHQMMSGHLRGAIATLSFEEILSQPEAFAQRVQQLTAEDLGNMGIQVVSFTIREIKDPSQYIKALERPQQAEVEKNAALGEAKATRDSAIGRATAEREATVTASQASKEAMLAKLQAETAVAEAQKIKEVQVQNYQSEAAKAKAEADLSYELQKAKTEQLVVEQKMGIDLAQKKKQIEVEESEIERRSKELIHTVQRPAEAESAKVITLAEAERQRQVAMAEAQAEAGKVRGLAEADVIRAKGQAEAEAIRLRGLAEAEGLKAKSLAEAEGMQAKAEAYKQYNEAAVSQMFIERLPELAAAVAAPLSKIDKIVLVSTGGASTGIEQITKGVVDVLAQVPGIAETLAGLDLRAIFQRVPAMAGGSIDSPPAGDGETARRVEDEGGKDKEA